MHIKTPALKRALFMLQELAEKRSPDGHFVSLRELLRIISELCRGELQVSAAESQAFIETSAVNMTATLSHISQHLYDTEDMLGRNLYGDDWLRVCMRRSEIEYVRSLYKSALPSGELEAHLDIEEIDDRLKQVSELDAGTIESLIPPGTPVNHWWWWWPEPAPEVSETGKSR